MDKMFLFINIASTKENFMKIRTKSVYRQKGIFCELINNEICELEKNEKVTILDIKYSTNENESALIVYSIDEE